MSMNLYINKIQDWFTSLSNREQKLVGLTAILIIGILLYYSLQNVKNLFHPAIGKQVMAARADYEALVPKIKQLKKLQQQKHNYSSLSVNELYNNLLTNPPIVTVLDKEQPKLSQSANNVEIKYNAASFDDLMAWLEKLHKQYGVTVVSVDVEKHAEKRGYVSAIIIITV